MKRLIITAGLCVLGLMLAVDADHQGTEIQFQTTPKFLKWGLTRQVSMRCAGAEMQATRASSTGKELVEVTKILVTFQNKFDEEDVVALVTTRQPAKSYINEGNLNVEGNVAGLGYMQLTWDQPFKMRMGTYKCVIHGRTKHNRSIQLSNTLYLTSKKPTLEDLLQRINENEQQSMKADMKHDEELNGGAKPEDGGNTAGLDAALAALEEKIKLDEAVVKQEISELRSEQSELKASFEQSQDDANSLEQRFAEEIQKLNNSDGELMEKLHTETGRVCVDHNSKLQNGRGQRNERKNVTFKRAYDQPPKIMLGTVVLDAEHTRTIRYKVKAEDVTEAGFQVKFNTWVNSKLYQICVDWYSFTM